MSPNQAQTLPRLSPNHTAPLTLTPDCGPQPHAEPGHPLTAASSQDSQSTGHACPTPGSKITWWSHCGTKGLPGRRQGHAVRNKPPRSQPPVLSQAYSLPLYPRERRLHTQVWVGQNQCSLTGFRAGLGLTGLTGPRGWEKGSALCGRAGQQARGNLQEPLRGKGCCREWKWPEQKSGSRSACGTYSEARGKAIFHSLIY